MTPHGIKSDIKTFLESYSNNSTVRICLGECTFESISFSDSSSNNLCGWVNAKNTDQFDWTIATGSTPSVKTGPRNDHTYNSSQGIKLAVQSFTPLSTKSVIFYWD